MSKLSDYLLNNTNIQDVPEGAAPGYEDNSDSDSSSSSGSFFDSAKKWWHEYTDAVSEGRPMWKEEATVSPVDWGTAGGNGSMPTTFSNSTYQSMQNPDTTLSDVGNAIVDRVSEITPQPIVDAFTPQTIAPNWQPRPLDDSVYTDTPGTPTASGEFGALEDESVRQKRMDEAAQYMADNYPRAYSAMLGAVSGAANVAGGIRNAIGGENSDWILRNAEKSEEAMKKFRQQWENQYGNSGYLLNPNGLANDIGNGIGSSLPIMGLSLLAPEAAVGIGTRAITSALTRAGLGRLAGSKVGQALIKEVASSPMSTAGDTMAEYGSMVDELVQSGMSEEEAREKAKSIIPRNIALDTLTLPGELYVMKGAKGLGRRFQAASTDSIGKRIGKGMARAGVMSVGSAIPEGYQEGAQNALEDNVKGERNTNWFSPFSWNDDDLEAARAGAVGGAFMGIPGNVAKGMQTYSNTGNAGIDATVDAANEYGLDPKGLLSIGARESGGDDVTAIGSASPNAFQITDESASDYGVDEMYPEWKTDLKQNAEAAAFILTKKIEENGGDFWAGVRAYNGAGQAADEYLATVQNTYNNIPDGYVSSGGGSGIQPYNLPTQGADIDEQVSNLTPEFQSALPTIGGILNEMGLADGAAISSAARTPEHNAEVGGAENSYHVHNDAVDIVLPEGTTQEQADAVAERFRETGAFKEVLFHDAGSGYHLHLGGYNGGLNSRGGGVGGTVEGSYNGDGGAAYMEAQREADREYQQEQRDRDNAYQQEITNIMNDNSAETIADDVDKEMKDAKTQQEEGMKALTPDQQKEEIGNYLDSVSQDDISDADFNTLWDATQSNDPKQIQTAYQTMQVNKQQMAQQTKQPIQPVNTPVQQTEKQQPKQQPAQQVSMNNETTNPIAQATQGTQDNKQTQPFEQIVQPPLNTAPNSKPIQQGEIKNETTQSTEGTNNQNVNTESKENQRENAETVQAKESAENKGTTGITENVRTDNAKQNIPAQYKLVSADDLISSDMPAYPQQYQPRNRNRLGMVAQVEDMSNQLNPSAVVDPTGNVNMGSPVINSKGVVLNGNGRTMAIRKAYNKGNQSAQAYKQYLKDNAEKLGIDPAAVDKIKNPMIVRQVSDDAPIEDIIHSTAGGSRMSASEQAKSDAKKIRTSTLDKYKKENSPDLSAPSNREFVKSVLDDITTDADRNVMYTENGQITKEAIRRVQDALFARAYGDDSLLNRMTESTDDNIRIVSKVMLQCAPKVAKLKEGQEHGDFYSEYDVSNVITQAAKDLIEAREAGKPISYKLRENDMFEASKRKDDEAIKITLKFFDDNKRRPRRIQEYVNSLADYVIGMGSPKLETESNPLFDGGERMTMDELANFTEEEINGGRNSNLHVESKRTDTQTESVPQTVQEESGTAGNASIQKSNETEVKENTHLQPVKDAIANGSYKLIAKEAVEYANNVVSGLKDGILTKEQAQLRVNDLVSALQTKESNGNSVMGNIPKFMQRTILDALKMTKDAINGNIEYAGMSKKETQAAKMLDETIKGIKDGSITPAKADDELRNARVAAKENGKQSYAFSKKLKEAEDFIKDKNNYGTKQEEREATENKEKPEEKQEETVRQSVVQPFKEKADSILKAYMAKKISRTSAERRLVRISGDANAAYYGTFDGMEEVKSQNKLNFSERSAAQDYANDAMKKIKEEYHKRQEKKKAKGKPQNTKESQAQETKATESKEDHKTESEPERTSPDEIDLRTISIEDAERQAMEALGIKPHKKPVLPKPTKGSPKSRKRTPIKDDETLTLHIVDQSDEALAEALKVFDEEASKLNANPMFNPRLMTAAMKIGAIHLQRGANKFIDWLKAMNSTDSRLKSYAPAVWKALQVFPKNGTLNEKQMTSLIQFVGVMYHHGITDKTDLRKRFIAALGVKNARYFDTAYTAIVEYPTAEELKGIDTKEENTVEETSNNEDNKNSKEESNNEQITTDEENYHGFLDGKTEREQNEIRSALSMKHNPFGFADGFVPIKKTIESDARATRDGRRKLFSEEEFKDRIGRVKKRFKDIMYDYYKYLCSLDSQTLSKESNKETKESTEKGGNNNEQLPKSEGLSGGHTGNESAKMGGTEKAGEPVGKAGKDTGLERQEERKNSPSDSRRPAGGMERESDKTNADRPRSGNDSTGNGTRRDKQSVLTPAQKKNAKLSEVAGHNYHINVKESDESGSVREKITQNIAAIKLLKQLEAEGRRATPAEQAVLAKYSGWGTIADAFTDKYGKENAELKEILTEEEYKSAKKAATTAFYTDPKIVNKIWEAVEKLGFKGGRVLDPSMGTGVFFGCMPENIASKSALTGVEIDNLTGRIAQQLYQKSNIQITGFEKMKGLNNYFDLAISNIPFENIHVHDIEFDKYNYQIHNYFFAKAMQKVRPGGLVVFITGQGTMQSKKDAEVLRVELSKNADLIAAVKLPNTAFKGNAKTDVTTDILILQKRETPAKKSKYAQLWDKIQHVSVQTGKWMESTPLNEYYVKNKDNMLGNPIGTRTQYGEIKFVLDGKDVDLEERFDKLIEKLPNDVYQPKKNKQGDTVKATKTAIADSKMRDGAFVIKDGVPMQNDNGVLKEVKESKANKGRTESYIRLRNIMQELIAAEIDPKSTKEKLNVLRKNLNRFYDEFVKKYGYLNERKNHNAFVSDPSYGTVEALERCEYTKEKGKAAKISKVEKTAIFKERTIEAIKDITRADTAADALAASLNNKGTVDIDYMAQLTGRDKADVIQELHGSIYKNPVSGNYETSEEYLSGNVLEKLEYAEEAAKTNPAYNENVKALQKVQPIKLQPQEIYASLGASWIPQSDVEDYANSLIDNDEAVKVLYHPALGTWEVQTTGFIDPVSEYQTNRRSFVEILDAALNNKDIKITHTEDKKQVQSKEDIEETTLANQKLEDIRNNFSKWLWEDDERAERLSDYYNRTFNNTALRQYSGSHLNFKGMNASIKLRDYQKNAIWRIMQNKNTLLAHCVGAGKTFTMQAAAMEMKRLGICQKPLFAVPKNVVNQFAKEFRILYPNANILIVDSDTLPAVPNSTPKSVVNKETGEVTEQELTPKQKEKINNQRVKRVRALSRIKTEDWDAIIISHTTLNRLAMAPEAYQAFYQDQIEQLEFAEREIMAMENKDVNSKRFLKELEKKKQNLQAKMEKAMSVEKKDIGITFEELGIDQIFVDEADKFKNLAFTTKLGRISGISSNGSQSAMDMFIKTQYLTKLNNGRGVVFATGTPISNTMNEMYTMMRYLNMDALKNTGNAYFDSWVSTFGQIVTKQERDPSGVGWRNTKAVKFANTPEMVRQFREVADVKRPEDIKIKRPKIKGGKPTVIAVEPTEALKSYIRNDIADRVKAIRSGNGFGQKGADNMLAVTNSLRQASLDMRLINPALGEEEGGKVRALADQVTQVYEDTEKEKGAQIIFCDLSTPKGTSDKIDEKTTDDDNSKESQDMYARIMKALLQKGIPKNQIAFVHDAKNDEEKQQLFEKVDSGELRVLIGSTEKMGAGTNFQHHLAALHHFTCPWRPRDLEQREGRILRYGNMFDEVQIFEYVTKDSYDANMWEKVKNKAMTIAQAMSGDLTTRIVDDADNGAITYAEAEALATGNPLMREKTEVDTEVMRYKGMLSGHLREVSNAQREIKIHAPEIPNNKAKMERIKKDIAQRQDLSGDKFKATIDGKTYTERKNADKALLTAIKDLKNNTVEEIGSIGGFAIKARKEVDYSSDKGVHYITKITLVKNFSYEAGPSIKSIESTINSKPETTLKDTEKETEKLNNSIKAWEKTAGAKFKYQDKLDALLKRQKEINDEFDKIENSTNESTENNEETTPAEYSVRDNSKEIQRSIQEVKDEIKNALPTAKDVTEDGNTITFIMPNDSKIVVDVQNQIALTAEQLAQAKKDHNIDGNVVVEGYAKKYGKDAYIALSQGARKGTGYHEVYHVAEDTVLNDKEKAALRKKYPNEEMRADKYAEWVEAKKHGKGTLFGKLFRKIQDFAKKMQAILTRTENVHNVFRKIESGEVWNRKAEESEAANAKLAKAARQKLQEDMQAFSKSVDDFMNGKLPPKDVKVMTTPLVMNLIGEKLLPIYIHTNVMEKILKGKHSGEMSTGIVKKIPKELTDPLMILKAINNQGVESKNQKIVVIDLKNNYGATIMVPFIMDVKANRYELSNVIESAYGRGNKRPNDKWYIKRLKRGDAVYANKKRIDHWLKTLSLAEAHNGLLVVDSFNLSTIIPDETDLGKLKRENPTKYSIRKTQDTPLNPKEREQEQRKEDILKAINDIVPVYTKSDVKKNSTTETYYDRRQKAGFVKTPTIREYGRILALNLDQQLKLKNNMELTTNVKQELEKNKAYAAVMGDKIKDMTPIQARAEGVSIFGSLYFNGNEEAAAARFPKYYEAFKNALKENEELNDKVNHITEMIGDYKAQNPVLRANSGMQMHDESQKKTTKGKINAILDKVYAEMVDELDPLTKVTKMAEKEAQQKLLYKYDVHKQALMAQGNAQSKANLLLNSGKDKEEAIHALNDKDMFNGAVQYKVNMNDIMDAIKNVPQEELEKIGADDARQGLAKYLIAMRTKELSNALDNDYVRPDGFDEEACYTIIKNAPESIKTAAKMVWDFNKNMINIMQQQGLINKKAADTMRKYAHYVPMYHDMSDMQDIDDFIGAVGRGGRGFVDIKPNIYEIKGGNERAIIDPIESMVRMTVTLLNKCQRNRVGQALARINQDFEGMGSIIAKDPTLKHEDPKKCAFSVYIGGKKVIYRTTPEVYSILTQVDENGASVLESILKPFASALRRGATISPPFIVRNFTRDTVTAGITSQTGFIPFVDSFRGMYKLTTDKQFKMDYLASGASMGTFIRSDVHGAKDLLSEITGDKYSSWPKGLRQIAQFISAVWNHYDKFANLVEDGTRAGEFMRARKKGIGLEEAGYLAKEVTLNFGRHGKAGKHINRAVPFFNATIQGTDKFIRAFKKNPARASFMTAVTIILPSIMAWALANGDDDDWYQDLDANTKYTNWCFKIGDTHILIPKPQEAGILFGSGVEAVLNQMMGKDPQAMKQWARQYAETLLPNIFPTLIAPLVEWQTNYSFWKGRQLVGKKLQDLPSELQYNAYTSEIAKALGDTWLAKQVKLSPIAIDNFISGYFGSAGRFIANMLNSPIDYLRDSSRPVEPAKYWYEMAFIGSFVRKNHEISEYQNRFYDLASDMKDDYNRMKHDNPKAKPPKGYKEMETAKKTVSKLNKEIQGIKSDTKMGPEQKLQQIELRQNKIHHFTKKFVTQYGR